MKAIINFDGFLVLLEDKKMNVVHVREKFDPKILTKFKEEINNLESIDEIIMPKLLSIYFEVVEDQGMILRNDNKHFGVLHPLKRYYKNCETTLRLCKEFLNKKLKRKYKLSF
jgi:hypothetical protein